MAAGTRLRHCEIGRFRVVAPKQLLGVNRIPRDRITFPVLHEDNQLWRPSTATFGVPSGIWEGYNGVVSGFTNAAKRPGRHVLWGVRVGSFLEMRRCHDVNAFQSPTVV